MKLNFEIPGRPIPQQRPRVMRGYTFDPKACRLAKEVVRLYAVKAYQTHKNSVLGGVFKPTASFAVRAHFYGSSPLADIDNLQKLLLDGLGDVFWANDRQITHIAAWKHAKYEGRELTTVEIEEL